MNRTIESIQHGLHWGTHTVAGLAGSVPVQHLVETVQHVRELPGMLAHSICDELFRPDAEEEIRDGNAGEAHALFGFKEDEIRDLIPIDEAMILVNHPDWTVEP